ncbi:MAG: hypothetical protein QNJ01_14415, partial [Desulfobacterales bacterium]|nr:hypothetical protein [Desulfobacterales bacterium]
ALERLTKPSLPQTAALNGWPGKTVNGGVRLQTVLLRRTGVRLIPRPSQAWPSNVLRSRLCIYIAALMFDFYCLDFCKMAGGLFLEGPMPLNDYSSTQALS